VHLMHPAKEREIDMSNDNPEQLALFDIDVDGGVLCVECKLPPPAEWCWNQRTDCPMNMPPRKRHQWVPRW
jgi:hypothetical protein